jgi:hypothetical protein
MPELRYAADSKVFVLRLAVSAAPVAVHFLCDLGPMADEESGRAGEFVLCLWHDLDTELFVGELCSGEFHAVYVSDSSRLRTALRASGLLADFRASSEALRDFVTSGRLRRSRLPRWAAHFHLCVRYRATVERAGKVFGARACGFV